MSKYLLSYTAATLMVNEINLIAQKYFELKNWDEVKKAVIDENIMQKGTISSQKRVYVELKRRLESLTDEQFGFLENSNSEERKMLLFLSILKTYRFIYEFIIEILAKKIMLFDYTILNSDYISFFESKALAHDELNSVSESTKYKLKQVLFRILYEASIIDSTKNKNIIKPYLSEELIKLIIKDDPKYLAGFLLNDFEIEKCKERYL